VSDEQAAPAIELHWQPAELRDAVASVTAAVPPGWSYLWPNFKVADAVLAMPEMQAVRSALRNLYDTRVRECGYGAAHEWLRALNLPLSVIAWVLEGEQ